jgi:hypothetical protein
VAGVKGEAKALLDMAQLLELDAQSKREQAYRMDPSLRPVRMSMNTQNTEPVSTVPDTIIKPTKTRKKT